MQIRTIAAAPALAFVCALAACQTSGSAQKPAATAVAPAEPAAAESAQNTVPQAVSASAPVAAGQSHSGALAKTEGPAPAAAKEKPQPVPAVAIAAAAPTAPAGTCAIPIAAVPPVPGKAGAIAGNVAENTGRGIVRGAGVGVANVAIASVIPGFGAVVGQAAAGVAGREAVKTAEDMRGSWTASDDAGCGCTLEFSKPGMVVGKKVLTQTGCRSTLWTNAARWKQETKRGFVRVDLVIYAKDGKTELARLDGKSSDYYQGNVNGELVTVWR